jgi:hypothetical protein
MGAGVRVLRIVLIARSIWCLVPSLTATASRESGGRAQKGPANKRRDGAHQRGKERAGGEPRNCAARCGDDGARREGAAAVEVVRSLGS